MKSLYIQALRVVSVLCVSALLHAAATPAVTGTIRLDPVLQGLSTPLYVTNAHDGTNRLFIVEQAGRIKVLLPGAASPTVFLDITSKVLSGGERGLLGLAFHPQFGAGANARFFVNYTRQTDGATVVAEYRVSADPNVAATSEAVLLTIPQPYASHIGGMIEFGLDGYLYIGTGDGGSGNDSRDHARNINDLSGKILRIDVDHPAGQNLYSSPPGNPYVGVAGSEEIFAVGMRNPFRFSFDRQTGQLYVGDVGQGEREAVEIVTAGDNFGARVDDETQCTSADSTRCALSSRVMPIAQYSHSGGRCSITGGYVYRGSVGTLPEGTYVFGDYCTGEVFSLSPGGSASVLLDTALNISSFGEDEAGEIHVVGLGGTVHRIASTSVSPESIRAPSAQVITAAAAASNVALASAGGVATASSIYSAGYPVSAVNNNERAGRGWGSSGGWADGTPGTFPDWVQITFSGSKTIDRVVVYSLQDNFNQPVEPTDTTAFATYGITAFTVQGWNGTSWITLATVSGNTLVKRTLSFAPTTTDRIRVNVTAARGAGAYITEIEAWTAAGGPVPTTTTLSTSGSPAAAGTNVSFTATVSGTNPTGNVGFSSDGAAIGGCTAVALTGSGNSKTAVCTTSSLATGSHSIVGSYTGDASNTASASASLAQVITGAGVGSNVALTSAGGVATASSIYSAGYPVSAVNNNERAGRGWGNGNGNGNNGNGGGWADGTPGTFPDWVQIVFNGSKTIDRVVVYTLQDNFNQPVEPTDTTAFATYGITAFTVQGWNGTSWITLATVSGNTLVKRTVSFAPTTTDRIRVNVTAARGAGAYITEIEAWTAAGGPVPTTTTLSTSGSPAAAGTNVSFTATVSGTNPTGNVGFSSDGAAIGGCTAVALTGSGNSKTAVCTTSSLATGSHSIVASYAGDANDAASTSAPLAQVTTAPTGAPGPAGTPMLVQMTDAPTFPGDYDGPTWALANRSIFAPWVHPGGDWRDSANVAQGNAYYATSADIAGTGDATLSVTALVARLLTSNTGIYLTTTKGLIKLASRSHATLPGPRLHIVTTTGTFDAPCIVDSWFSASTNLPLGDQQTLEFPAILKFDLSAVTGTVTQATLTLRVSNVYVVPARLAVNYLDPPTLNLTTAGSVMGNRVQGIAATVVQDNALAAHPSVLLYNDLVSKEYIRANFQGLGGEAPPNLTNNAQIIQWPQYGLSAARVWSITTNQRLVSWHHWAEPKQNPPKSWQRDFGDGYTHLFVRYLLEIGTDVKTGMTELGMKLPGMAGTYDFSNSGGVTLPQPRDDGTWEMRLWHGGVSPRAHPDIYHLATYYYGVEHPLSLYSGEGDTRYTAGFLKAGRVYSIEQEIKLNTLTNGVANADGIERVWLDGVLMYENTAIRIRGYDNVRIQSIPWVNIYHGGLGFPAAPFHYDIGGIAVATEYIGPPKVVQ